MRNVGNGLCAVPPENVNIFRICEANNDFIAYDDCDFVPKSPERHIGRSLHYLIDKLEFIELFQICAAPLPPSLREVAFAKQMTEGVSYVRWAKLIAMLGCAYPEI